MFPSGNTQKAAWPPDNACGASYPFTRSVYMPRQGHIFHAMESSRKGTVLRSFCFCKKNPKAAARTCKKLPVASFCASETAETGSTANGCEHGDHVSRSRLRPATSVQKGCCTSDARPMFFENGLPHCKLTGANRIQKGELHVIFVAVGICVYSILIESHELNRKFCHELQGNPFPQPHSYPFVVRHNLLCAKKSALNLYKAACPFVLRLEFAAVQIIAVDIVQNSGSHIVGYMMNAGKPIKNTVSTGDLNRGRRVKPRVLFDSFCTPQKE